MNWKIDASSMKTFPPSLNRHDFLFFSDQKENEIRGVIRGSYAERQKLKQDEEMATNQKEFKNEISLWYGKTCNFLIV